jgi:NAD(P)-dependent dehydrogenase (short-subunit alcohol dehydrogenase family)
MTTTRDRERLDADAMKTRRMDNSVAPVTGASEGGGKVVADQFTAAGVTVYVGSRDARRGQTAVDEIGGDARLLVLATPFTSPPRSASTSSSAPAATAALPVECSSPPTTPATSPASPRRGRRVASARLTRRPLRATPVSRQQRRTARQRGLRSMRLLGLDHIAIVVRDIDETIARAGDTVDGRAGGERILAGDIDLQFLLCGETRWS